MESANISSCLICLENIESPKNLYDVGCKKLLDLLLGLLGFQIDISGDVFNICQTCEGRLVSVQEFKDLCGKSLEKFKAVDCKKQFTDNHENISTPQNENNESESDKEIVQRPKRRAKECVIKRSPRILRKSKIQNDLDANIKGLDQSACSLKVGDDKESSDFEDSPAYISDNEDDSSDASIKHVSRRRGKRKCSKPLKVIKRNRKYFSESLFSETDVLQAITECENYMTDMKNRKCLHCDYEAPNAKSMWIHMPLKHKEEYVTWCKYCNIQAEELQTHKESARCFEERCKFCKKVCPNKNMLLQHLLTHSENRLLEENRKKTRNQFSKEEVLDAITASTKYMSDLKNRTCLYCKYIATRAKTLAVHLRCRHKEYFEAWCSRCNIQTENLKAHTSSSKCYESICPLCDKKFTRINRLTIHLKSHCRDGFVKKVDENNIDWDDDDDDYIPYYEDNSTTNKIEEESKDCSTSALLNTDNDSSVGKMHSHKKPLKKIQQKNTQKRLLESMKSYYINRKYPHMARSNDTQTFCLICKKKVRSIKSHNLTKHRNLKVKLKPSPGSNNKLCTVCGKIFKNNQILTVHMRKHTGERSFKCSYCEKLLPNKTYLRDHERRHTGEKPFVCHVCGRRFVSNGEQKQHMKIHEGGPVQCTICNKEFPRPGVLALHMKRHTGENPFTCVECGISYHRASLLKNHMRSHSNERPFKCSFCDKYFSCKSTLKKHEHVHKGIKPYKCSVCSFSCTQAHGLSSHMKQHPEDPPQPDRPYKCLFCHRQFDTNAMLMSHTNNQHREQANR